MHSGATLSLRQKDIISQVAQHLIHTFQMRSGQAGSLYRSNASGRYNVGQSASLAFYKYENGKQTYSDPSTLSRLAQFRGPFNRATDWLSQDLRIKGSLLNQTLSPRWGMRGTTSMRRSTFAHATRANILLSGISEYLLSHSLFCSMTLA
jgi:hypothetical protein